MNKVIHLSERLWCDREMAFAHFANVDPVVGGLYELFWDPEDLGSNSTRGCRITAIASPQLICFEWKSPSQFAYFANRTDPLTHVTITLVPDGNETVVHVVHSGWRGTPEWEEARTWQVRAWAGALTRLRTRINGC
jgi:hypothetical protein